MPTQKHLNQTHLAAIAHGALREYTAQPQGKAAAQNTPNRKRDISVFVARFNTADGAPRYPWTLIREMYSGEHCARRYCSLSVIREAPPQATAPNRWRDTSRSSATLLGRPRH